MELGQCAVHRGPDQPLSLPLQGTQDATAPPEAMAQPYPPTQYPPPPQNGIPSEYAPPPPHPTQDYSGQTPVPPEHGMTLYTPAQTHPEQPGTEASTQPVAGAQTVPVRGPAAAQPQGGGPAGGGLGGASVMRGGGKRAAPEPLSTPLQEPFW